MRRHEKLQREERFNTEALHVRHVRAKAFGRTHRKIVPRANRWPGSGED